MILRGPNDGAPHGGPAGNGCGKATGGGRVGTAFSHEFVEGCCHQATSDRLVQRPTIERNAVAARL